ncbi:unnamed protein product [Meloidogyne enterolobii]|uniref:Uncharacterized protein n=1 Tax=Meloidogyne enterolobii TaxID=390850 RepID=A0ACB1AX74_MELEN
MEEKIYRQIFFTPTINEENINLLNIGIKYSKLMKIAVRKVMGKTGKDSDEDEEYLIRRNYEGKIEHVGSSKGKEKQIGDEEIKIEKEDLIPTFAEFLCLKYFNGYGKKKTYSNQEKDEKRNKLLGDLNEKISRDLLEIYKNNEQFQKDYSNERGVKWRFIIFFDLKDYKKVIEKGNPLLINSKLI